MKRKLICFILCICAFLSFSVCAAAETATGTIPDTRLLPRLNDTAELLSFDEQTELLSKLDEISERLNFDVVIYTVDNITADYASIESFADDYFDYNGFGYGVNKDGCVLVISMAERDYRISTTGYGITAFTDAGIEFIGNEIVDAGLSDGYYADAFDRFAGLCEEFVTHARSDSPYDGDDMPVDTGAVIFFSLIAAFGAAVIISFIIMAVMRSKMKTVSFQKDADNYALRDTMKLNDSSDTFLYSQISRTKIEKQESSGGSSTHIGSSGTSHGGGGGKF